MTPAARADSFAPASREETSYEKTKRGKVSKTMPIADRQGKVERFFCLTPEPSADGRALRTAGRDGL